MKKNIIIASIAALLIPAISFAALDGLSQLLTTILDIIKTSVIPIVFGLAIVFFFWGLAQFILKDAGNDKTREDGKKKMIWGIVALFVMASILGIIQLLGSALGVSNSDIVTPSISTGTAGGGSGTTGGSNPGDCNLDPTAYGCQ